MTKKTAKKKNKKSNASKLNYLEPSLYQYLLDEAGKIIKRWEDEELDNTDDNNEKLNNLIKKTKLGKYL